MTLAAAIVASLVLAGAARAATDPTSEAEVKAAFLFNFAKFTDWPAHAAEAPLTMCIVGDWPVAAALIDAVRNQRIGGHAIDASAIAPDAPMRPCDVLFVSMSETRRTAGALEAVKSLPILTVSDDRQFTQSGGVVQLFVENERMRFSINTEAADRAGLRLSSRLLSLAKIVKDAHAHP
ncbi:MAG: YfiR family protein [Acidobacteriota bacterium]